MQTIVFRDIQIEVDIERTRQTYIAIEAADREVCSCAYCENFRALGTSALPNEVLSFFKAAGIDPELPSETYEVHKIKEGTHLYGGEYNFFGIAPIHEKYSRLGTSTFEFRFDKPSPITHEEFHMDGGVSFEFYTELPWVLAIAP